MERTLVYRKEFPVVLFGACLITLCSFVRIPFYPVAFTLQTFAIFLIALTQRPKQAFVSVLGYLGFAFMMNPHCFVGKCGGYFIAFPIAAYLTSLLSKKYSPLFAVLSGQAIIYALGFLWLIPFVGMKIAAFNGVAIFIGSDLLKNLIAIRLGRKYGISDTSI